MEEITAYVSSLKNLLSVCEEKEILFISELGDTGHPDKGFVDESHFPHLRTVGALLALDYDFEGLVVFRATIGRLSVEYDGSRYKIAGDKKELKKLASRLSQNSL